MATRTILEDPDLVLELARQTVQAQAPEELALFEATGAAFVADPSAVARQTAKDETLGFGIEVAAALAPSALAVARARLGGSAAFATLSTAAMLRGYGLRLPQSFEPARPARSLRAGSGIRSSA